MTKLVDVRFLRRDPDPDAATPRWIPHGGEQWPLATLAAFLFAGRECDDVRALLRRGRLDGLLTRLEWDPIALDVEAFAAVERELPPSLPESEHAIEPAFAREISLVAPPDGRGARVLLKPGAPLVATLAAQAQYTRFDYGPWADVWETRVAPEQVPGVLAVSRFDSLRGGPTLAARLGDTLSTRDRRAPEAPPAAGADAVKQLWRDLGAWYEVLFRVAAAHVGASVRFVVPRPGHPPPWPMTRIPWRAFP